MKSFFLGLLVFSVLPFAALAHDDVPGSTSLTTDDVQLTITQFSPDEELNTGESIGFSAHAEDAEGNRATDMALTLTITDPNGHIIADARTASAETIDPYVTAFASIPGTYTFGLQGGGTTPVTHQVTVEVVGEAVSTGEVEDNEMLVRVAVIAGVLFAVLIGIGTARRGRSNTGEDATASGQS